MQVLKNLVGDGCDLIGVQVQEDRFRREISRYFLEIRVATGDIQTPRGRTETALGTHAGGMEAQYHKDKALEEETHGEGPRQPQVHQIHAGMAA